VSSPPSSVLVIGRESDPHTEKVARLLRDSGRPVAFFDTGLLPSRAAMVYEGGGGQPARRLLREGPREIDLDAVGAVWVRRPSPIVASVPDRAQHYLRAETSQFLVGLLSTADRCWLPGGLMTIQLADCKLEQLWRAERLGFEIPSTLVTNSPRDLLAFRRRHRGMVISKLGHAGAFDASYPGAIRYTEPVTRRDLAHLGRLRNCPVIFQANVAKRLELRVTVVGSAVFAAEIHTQESRQTAQDSRRYDLDCTPHRVHQLPEAIAARCVALTRELGLRYGAIDLILRPDGQYVFLEINPNGQFLWIEDLTGLPISAAVAALLDEGARAYENAGDRRPDLPETGATALQAAR
jgi:hypothetical protein